MALLRYSAALLAMWCMHLFPAQAQQVVLKHFTEDEGLPSNTVHSVYGDRLGYIWLCTDRGLCRYNGIEFKTFTVSNGLPDNEIFNVQEDGEGRLWMSTYNGRLGFYRNGHFYTAQNTPWLNFPVNAMIYRSMPQANGGLTFITSGNRFLYIKGNRIGSYLLPRIDTAWGPLAHAVRISDQRYRLQYLRGIADVDTNGRLLSLVPHPTFSIFLSGNDLPSRVFLQMRSDGVYDAGGNKLYPVTKIRPIFERPFAILLEPQKKRFIMSHSGGILINDSINLFIGKQVTSLARDKDGNIWLNTRGGGAYAISRNFLQIKEYRQAYKGRVLSGKTVNGALRFATDRGSMLSLQQGKLRTLDEQPSIAGGDAYLTKANFLFTDKLDYWFYGPTSRFLSATTGRMYFPSFGNIAKSSKGLFQYGNYVFVSEITNIRKYDYRDLYRAARPPELSVAFAGEPDHTSDRIFSRALDPRDGAVWLCKKRSMYRWHNDSVRELKNFRGTQFKEFGFYGSYLVGIDAENRLRITTLDGEMQTDSISLPDCVWGEFYRIDHRRVLISSNNYYRLLTLYPPKHGKAAYTLRVIEDWFIPAKAEYVAADSLRSFFFKNGTITEVPVSVLEERQPPPRPLFSAFHTRKHSYLPLSGLVIPYNESRNIRIGLDYLSYTGKALLSEYSVTQDSNEDWHPFSGNEINLSTPGYGNFTIKVRSKIPATGFSAPAVLQLTVQRPFWATWWFVLCCLFSLAALVWSSAQFVAWRKVRRKQKEHEADMKYQQSEYKALNALMNPHFIFNSLNNIQSLINKDEKRTANDYLVIFSDLVRQNMHNIAKGFISLQQELDLVENYLELEKLRFKERISYEITVADEVDTEDIEIPPLMIQPLVENAVKHGLLPKQAADGKIRIMVYEQDNKLYIEVADNGVGLRYAEKHHSRLHESFTLSNMQRRAEHLQKIQQHAVSITVVEINEQGQVKGTRATITMELGA